MSFWEKLFGQRHQAASGSPTPNGQAESATFVEECAKPAYVEQAESRTGGDRAFRHVPDALNARRYAEAGQMAQQVISNNPDLDLGYCWAASAYSGTQKYEEARSILTEGLKRAKRKYNLCIRLGNAERDLGNIQGAVYWWTQAVHCQQSIRTGDEHDPYLYLAYVADTLGLNDVAGSLFSRVDRMRPGTARLSPAAEDTLRARVKDGDSTSMTAVLRSLHKQYFPQDAPFVTAEKATPPTASTALAELNRTLKQLEVKLQQEGAPALPIITLRVGEAPGQTVIRWHYVTGYGATSVLLDSDAATQWLTKELSPFGVKIVKRGFTDGSRERGSPERCFVWSVEMQKNANPSKSNAAPEPAAELKPQLQSAAAPHLSAANDGQSRTVAPSCESCKSTQRLRLWLDAPQADQYLCQDCVHAKGLDNADGDTPLPSVMPQLIAMTEIRDAPGKGATAFMAGSDASKRDRPVEAVEKYLAAIETGLTPAFDAVARNYVGGMFLKQGHIQAALLQLRRALFASPQAPESVHLAAIRFSIVSEELGATTQAKKAAQIATLAAARMSSPPPPEPVEYIRQAVREHRSKTRSK